MAENIVIKLDLDVTKFNATFDQALNNLEKIGQVDKETADQIRKDNIAFAERSKAIDDVNQSTDEAKTSMDSLNQSAKDLGKNLAVGASGEAVKKIAKDTEVAAQATQRLTSQLRNLKNQLSILENQGKANTAEFTKLAIAAGKLEDQIGDTSRRVKQLGSDTRALDALVSAVTGLAGAFSIAQGASALLGDSNEDLQKALLKVQGSMAVLNGLQAVQNTLQKQSPILVELDIAARKLFNLVVGQSTGVLKTFRIALAASVAGAVILGIILLVENWSKLKAAISGVTDEQKALNDLSLKAVDIYAGEIVKVDLLFNKARNLTITTKERKAALEELKSTYPGYLKNLTDENVLTDEGAKLQKKLAEAIILKARIQGASELIAENEKKILEDQLVQQQTNFTAGNRVLDRLTFGFAGAISSYRAARNEVVDLTKQNGFLNLSVEELIKSLSDLGGDPTTKPLKDLGSDTPIPGSFAALEKHISDIEKQLHDKLIPGTQAYIDKQKELTTANLELEKAIKAVKDAQGDSLMAKLPGGATALTNPEDSSEVITDAEIKQAKLSNQILFQELSEQSNKEHQDRMAEIERQQAQQSFDVSVAFINQLFELGNALGNQRIQLLQDQADKGIISEKKAADEIAKIKRKQAIANKEAALFNIAVNTAVGVSKVIAETGLLATILSVLIIALGAAQAATVLAQPLPKFAKGTESLKGGQSGKDSIPILAMPGERIVPTHINKQLEGIKNEDLPVLLSLAMPAKSFGPDLPHMSDEMREAMYASLKLSGGSEIDYALLAKEIGKNMSEAIEKIPVYENYWDEEGHRRSVRQGFTRTDYLNKRFDS